MTTLIPSKACPCGSSQSIDMCCALCHANFDAATPEELMRSRYSAFVTGNVDYIEKTMRGPALEGFNKNQTQEWTLSVHWLDLTIISMRSDLQHANKGYVEFIARYLENQQIKLIHECSEFHYIHGKWYYVTGINPQKMPDKLFNK